MDQDFEIDQFLTYYVLIRLVKEDRVVGLELSC